MKKIRSCESLLQTEEMLLQFDFTFSISQKLSSDLLQEEEVTERINSSVEDPLDLGKSDPIDFGWQYSALFLPLLSF